MNSKNWTKDKPKPEVYLCFSDEIFNYLMSVLDTYKAIEISIGRNWYSTNAEYIFQIISRFAGVISHGNRYNAFVYIFKNDVANLIKLLLVFSMLGLKTNAETNYFCELLEKRRVAQREKNSAKNS